jgi:putative transcriptional regulator
MPIVVNLDVMLARRKMTLTELSERVNITIANLSVLKSSKAKQYAFQHWKEYAECWNASPAIF